MRASNLFAEAIPRVDLTLGPQLALVIFALLMLGVFAWILRPRAAQTYAAIRHSILDEEG